MSDNQVIEEMNMQYPVEDHIQTETISMENIPEYDIQDYDIFNEKSFNKYIADIEKIVRSSFEYEEFISYLRNYMDMNKCSFFENVTNADTTKIKIHIHHCPFTLYDIVMTIFNKRMFYKESLEAEMVAKEVMYIHYFLMVGLIPLAETVHELVHNQLIFIPLDKVMGKYEEFEDRYREWIPAEAIDKLQYLRQQTEIYNQASNIAILQQKPIIIDIPNEDTVTNLAMPSMKVLMGLMKDKIDQIKNNNYKLENNADIYDSIDSDSDLICPIKYE